LEAIKIHALNKYHILIYTPFKLEILDNSFYLSLMLLIAIYQQFCFRALQVMGKCCNNKNKTSKEDWKIFQLDGEPELCQ